MPQLIETFRPPLTDIREISAVDSPEHSVKTIKTFDYIELWASDPDDNDGWIEWRGYRDGARIFTRKFPQ